MGSGTPRAIRARGPADTPAFRELRLRALQDHPDAFGRTPEEVDTTKVLAERFRENAQSEFDFVLGAFDGDRLVGLTGCHRERAVKTRHIASSGVSTWLPSVEAPG